MNQSEILLNHCIEILNSFPKDKKSLTVHVEDYFYYLTLKETDKLFIVDVFAETIKYYKVLKVVVDQFYEKGSESVFERDRNVYMVILFLILFRLDSLGMEGLKQFLGKDRRMNRFLSFLTGDEQLWSFVESRWDRMYDHEFVRNELLSGITKWMTELCALSDRLTAISASVGAAKKTVITPTKPEPFKLTKPKPKRVPMPELIPEMEKPREIPQSTYSKLDDSKKPLKKDARILLEEAEKLKPSCADKGISTKTMEKLQQIVKEREKELQFNSIKARPNPKSNSEASTLKLNTATILREWKLYENRQKKKIDEMKKLEEGTFNSQQFEEWQQSVRAADLAEKISQLEKHRLEGKISYEEAILNRENLIRENKAIVESLKRDTNNRMEKFMKEKLSMEERAKAQVERIMASQEGAKEAKISVQMKNKSIAREIAAESRRLQEEALIEAEAEMRRKIDIIAEIRALEGSQSNNQKILDPTMVAGYGLLCEMSLAELKERLTLCKKRTEEQLSIKKDNIQDNKKEKEKLLADTMELIEICRSKSKESSPSDKSEQITDILNSEQLKELNDLKTNLEMKRIQRLNKQNKDKSRSFSSKETTVPRSDLRKEGTFDLIQQTTRSQTAEKLAQMLSV